jgi:hypothetical protein
MLKVLTENISCENFEILSSLESSERSEPLNNILFFFLDASFLQLASEKGVELLTCAHTSTYLLIF